MAELVNPLVPIIEFNAQQLGARMIELVGRNHGLLEERHILGPLHRYHSPINAEDSVNRLQRLYAGAKQNTFVVVDSEKQPQGLATSLPDLLLSRLRLPLPPGLDDGIEEFGRRIHLSLLVRPLARLAAFNKIGLPKATPNVTAWVDHAKPELLPAAYKGLVDKGGRPWTIEPTRSPQHIHDAITASRLMPVRLGWFDDQETKRSVPPRTRLYTRLRSDWLTSHGALKELMTGGTSWLDDIDQYGARYTATK